MIIFLEIYGVLNHYTQSLTTLDENHLKALMLLCKNIPNHEIVICSRLRLQSSRFKNVQQKLEKYGFNVIDHTSKLPGDRLNQIEQWLAANRPNEEQWMVISSDDDVIPSRTLVTDSTIGLMEAKVHDWLVARKK